MTISTDAPTAAADDWRDGALCAQTDPELFHPEQGNGARPAKRICFACDVRRECLTYALAHPELDGIWGGTTLRERQGLRRDAA